MWFQKKDEQSKIIVRACMGCILPDNAKLIGNGSYLRIEHGKKIDEPYYDYEIEEIFFESYFDQNYIQLVKYNLIDEEKKEESEEDKNPVKETTLRGYARELKKKDYK